jgi:hypothetical protein
MKCECTLIAARNSRDARARSKCELRYAGYSVTRFRGKPTLPNAPLERDPLRTLIWIERVRFQIVQKKYQPRMRQKNEPSALAARAKNLHRDLVALCALSDT